MTAAVRLAGIRKTFGDLVAVDDVDLEVQPGEVLALLGENGAGKTTLMRILYGLTSADAGSIEIAGEPVQIGSPKDALAHGIGMVTQHFALVKPMTVLENLMLTSSGLGPLDEAAARARLDDACRQLGAQIDPGARVEDLSVGEQQRVEILKALYRGARVLILDEPTAVLVPQEVQGLLEAITRLTADGLAVLFISHKLHEVKAISDRVAVLRHGRVVDTVETAGSTPAELAELMVGRHVGAVLRTERRVDEAVSDTGRAVLTLDGVGLDAPDGGKPLLDDVSLEVRAGEILALAGVSGNGQRELAAVLSGMTTPSRGTVRLEDRDLAGASPSTVVAAGLGRIPEDRHGSVVDDLSVADNLVMEDLDRFRRGPFINHRAIRAHAQELIEAYGIKARPADRIGGLSGGNMQKVLLARVLSKQPVAVVVAQPTRGLDVGAGEYVHGQLLARRAAGSAILLISEDLDEIHALADRIAVMYEGRIMGILDAETASRNELGLLMAGTTA